MRSFNQSVAHALHGIFYMLRTQRNFRIQVVSSVFITCLGFFFQLSLVEWLFISSAIFRVLSHEAINTSVEELADVCETKRDLNIKNVKDTSASYVILAAVYSVVVGSIIFIPKILSFSINIIP